MNAIKSLFVLFVLVLFVNFSYQRGTLYLNEIQAIQDAITLEETLPIECTLWEDNLVYLDRFDGLFSPGIGGGSGVDVDGALLHLGTWVFPNDLDVAGTVTINGLLQVNGGFFADDGDYGDSDGNGLDYAFEVQDNTGDAFIAGQLNVFSGINNIKQITNPDGTFSVADTTGETTTSGLLMPNGGIDVNNGQITVQSDGETFATGSLNVFKDLILGTSFAETALLVPFTNGPGIIPTTGGRTTLQGQDAFTAGGHIVLNPGISVGASKKQEFGDIILGLTVDPQNLSINRVPAAAGNAGSFIFGGQDSSGKGGDLIIRGGNTNSAGLGGNIILSPGQASSYGGVSGFRGLFYLGSPDDGSSIPFYLQRPDVTNSRVAGSTFITGQNVTTGNSGATRIFGGDGSTSGGNIYIEPGMNGNRQGKIFFGSNSESSTTLRLLREEDFEDGLDAGPTWFIGQDSIGGDGGDLYFEGGRGSATRCGDLYISPGRNSQATSSGTIYWGTNTGNPELRVSRPISKDSPAHDTTIAGTSSSTTGGGDLILVGGFGFSGGDVHLIGGFGEEDYGGEINISGGSGTTGGDVVILSGQSDSGDSGNIFFSGGDASPRGDAGTVFFAAQNGDVSFNANQLYLDSVPLFYDNNETPGEFVLSDTTGSNTLTLTPNSIIGVIRLINGGIADNMIVDRRTLNSNFRATINPYEDIVGAAEDVRAALNELRNGLVAHGLIEVN